LPRRTSGATHTSTAPRRLRHFDRVPELPILPSLHSDPGQPQVYIACVISGYSSPFPTTTTATNFRCSAVKRESNRACPRPLLRIHVEEGAQGRRRAHGRRRAVRLRPLRHRGGQRRRPRLPHRRLVRSQGSLFYHSSSSAVFFVIERGTLLAVTLKPIHRRRRRPPVNSPAPPAACCYHGKYYRIRRWLPPAAGPPRRSAGPVECWVYLMCCAICCRLRFVSSRSTQSAPSG
jgi:hypothetical protein